MSTMAIDDVSIVDFPMILTGIFILLSMVKVTLFDFSIEFDGVAAFL